MVQSCVAPNCKSIFKKGVRLTFHNFPRDPVRRKLWETKLRRANFKATDYSKICSKHFTPDSYDLKKFGGTWLKSNAVPSIFDFGENSNVETTSISHPSKSPGKQEMPSDESLYAVGSSTKVNGEIKQLSCLGDSNSKQTFHNLRKGKRTAKGPEIQCSWSLKSNLIPPVFGFSTDKISTKPPSMIYPATVEQFCCVPLCLSASDQQDPLVTFHEFPSHPDVSAKWIQQINIGISDHHKKPMWVPRGKVVICSKHFVQTDFKDDSDTLKPRAVPTIFGHRYIGVNQKPNIAQTPATKASDPPLIFKLVKQPGGKGKFPPLNIIDKSGSSRMPKGNMLQSEDVSGNVIDMHNDKDSYAELKVANDNNALEMVLVSSSTENVKINSPEILNRNRNSPNRSNGLFNRNKLKKMSKTKCLNLLVQRSKVIQVLKSRVASLTKENEDLINKYKAQERHMSSKLVKRVSTIRKSATKGDSCATFILEQIKGYTEKYMHWSDSTLSQCAVWVKKALHAYQYCLKAEFFKLPFLSTVKRFMKNHPELRFGSEKVELVSGNNSSSDSDFDSDMEVEESGSNKENVDASTSYETVPTEVSVPEQRQEVEQNNTNNSENPSNDNILGHAKEDNSEKIGETCEISVLPLNIDGPCSEVEVHLSSGEVLHCYTSNISDGADGSQYYFIPNENLNSDEKLVEATDEILSIIQQNFKNSQLPSS